MSLYTPSRLVISDSLVLPWIRYGCTRIIYSCFWCRLLREYLGNLLVYTHRLRSIWNSYRFLRDKNRRRREKYRRLNHIIETYHRQSNSDGFFIRQFFSSNKQRKHYRNKKRIGIYLCNNTDTSSTRIGIKIKSRRKIDANRSRNDNTQGTKNMPWMKKLF